jgi:hypothetical protein
MINLKEYFEAQFYTEALMFLTLIIALFVTIIRKKIDKKLKLFPFYFGFFIGRLVFRYILIIDNGNLLSWNVFFNYIDSYLEFFLVMTELLIFMHFFYYVLNSPSKRKTIKIFSIIFIIFSISLFITDNILQKHITMGTITQMFFLEAVFLLISCFLYYLQIFKSPPTLNLLNEPPFFVITGLFFFLICSLPYSIILDYLFDYYRIYSIIFSIIYIFYILLFIMIIKAFLCKPIKMK